MHAYALSFNFREPYQVLMDADIIRDAARFKMKLGSMLENTLHGAIKPMITQCCIRHLYAAEVDGATQKGDKEKWIEVAKQAERRRCGHHELEEPLSAVECIGSVVDPKGGGSNKHRYVVASQDLVVRKKMRGIVGVPLIYINRSVMILEPMAAKSEEVREAEEVGKRKAGLKGRRGADAGDKRKRDDGDGEGGDSTNATEQPVLKRSKVRGVKGPNPLSIKKSKKDPAKSIPQRAEEERSVIHKVSKRDPQAADKALQPDEAIDGEPEAPRKRKRKRKEKDDSLDGDIAVAEGLPIIEEQDI